MKLKERIKNVHCGQSALVAGVVSFLYLVALPLQTYLGNAQMFDYSVWDLLPEMLALFACAFVATFLAEIITEPLIGRLLMLAVVWFGILGYLQVSILSVGLPSLNGELWLFHRPSIMNYVGKRVFILSFIVILCAYKWLIRYVGWAAGILLVMSIAFVFDGSGGIQKRQTPTKFDAGFCPSPDMFKSIELSTNRNVIVIVIDSAPADIVDAVMQEHAELQSQFSGFVGFRNNIGMHDNTTRAMTAMMTGSYLEKDTDIALNAANFWSEQSAVNGYYEAGYDMYIRHYVGNAYTNRRKSFTKFSIPKAKYTFLKYTNCAPFVTLKDVLFYRLAFYRHKRAIIEDAMRRGFAQTKSKGLGREWNLYPILAAAPVSTNDARGVFCVIHSEGLHIPIPKNGKGEDLPVADDSRAAIKDYAPYVLNHVAGFMQHLKELGVYDQSFITIVADHGILYDPKWTMLWVKPVGGNLPFRSCDIPTSHCRIADLLKKSVSQNLTYEQIENILRMDDRKMRIRQVTPGKWWQRGAALDTYDLFFDAAGNEVRRVNLGSFKID